MTRFLCIPRVAELQTSRIGNQRAGEDPSVDPIFHPMFFLTNSSEDATGA
jgi:hypothetical protein